MALLSKSKLFPALDEFFGTTEYTTKKLKAEHLSNETYGRDSMIYVWAGERRAELEAFLTRKGFRVFPKYSPGGGRTEIQVSYFKGYHWNE